MRVLVGVDFGFFSFLDNYGLGIFLLSLKLTGRIYPSLGFFFLIFMPLMLFLTVIFLSLV